MQSHRPSTNLLYVMVGADGFAEVIVHHHAGAIGTRPPKEGEDAGTSVGVAGLERGGTGEVV